MANNDLAIRFTEEKYLTKSEVSKELKMSIIDNIWSNILSYRSKYSVYLPLKTIDKNSILFCNCPTIGLRLNTTETKLIRVLKDYCKFNATSGDLIAFEERFFIESLLKVIEKHNVDMHENDIKALLHGDFRALSSTQSIILNYYKSLQYLKSNIAKPIDIDFLAGLYSALTGNPELTSFYRSKDDNNPGNRIIIDRIYTSAPIQLIEPMMNDVFAFITNKDVPFNGLTKAIVVYYYVNYIKPFPDFSDEISLLLAKATLGHEEYSDFAIFLPLESLLSDQQDVIAKIFNETQKTYDITYFVNYCLKQFDVWSEQMLDFITNLNTLEMKQDYFQIDNEKEEEAVEEVILKEVNEIKEENTIKSDIQEINSDNNKQANNEIKLVDVASSPQIAVDFVPRVLDEKQAALLEEHLLELDSSLKKKEAHFYARHCTLGKNYTIAQFKKSLKCVYETARTSMDHLVELGYYRKSMVKNKNVYTPVMKK